MARVGRGPPENDGLRLLWRCALQRRQGALLERLHRLALNAPEEADLRHLLVHRKLGLEDHVRHPDHGDDPFAVAQGVQQTVRGRTRRERSRSSSTTRKETS